MRYRNRVWLAPAAALTLVIATAGSAYATVVPPSGQVLTSSVAPSFYSYATDVPYWSVIAENPQQPSDYDLYLYNVSGAEVGYSDYGVGYTDFVAVDSNSGTEPYQNWFATVTRYTGTGPYALQAQYGASTVNIPTPTHQGTTGPGDPDLAFMALQSTGVVNISDIYLTAGESFWATTMIAAKSMYLLEANPSNSATFIQGRSQATISQHTQVIDGCTLYTAQYTGWHALVIVSDTYPQSTNPGSGVAFGIHAYNATRPAELMSDGRLAEPHTLTVRRVRRAPDLARRTVTHRWDYTVRRKPGRPSTTHGVKKIILGGLTHEYQVTA